MRLPPRRAGRHGPPCAAVVDDDPASAIVETVLGAGHEIADPLPAGHGHGSDRACRQASPVLAEAFLDRAYEPGGLLVSRAEVVVHDPAVAAKRALRMARDGSIVDLGSPVAALCVHSDTPGAHVMASAVSAASPSRVCDVQSHVNDRAGDSLGPTRGDLPSEGCVRGSIQVPPSGQPIIFLADHPVTGGYPVVGVVPPASCDAIAQARPGTPMRLRSRGLAAAPPTNV